MNVILKYIINKNYVPFIDCVMLLHDKLRESSFPEHATLWGGELVFKNVELRLDVLQVDIGAYLCPLISSLHVCIGFL